MTDKEKIKELCWNTRVQMTSLERSWTNFPEGTDFEYLYQAYKAQLEQTNRLIYIIERAIA